MEPEVSVIVVCRNESRYIRECLESVVGQFDDRSKYEVILVDGQSEDETVQVATRFLEERGVAFHLLENPKRILAAGWNLGIVHSRGRYFIRPDAHAILGPRYISQAMDLLHERPDAAAVGGILETRAKTSMGKLIREALSMRTGVGNSPFRVGGSAGYVDTVVYGLYRKEAFERSGLFNEHLVRHQDTEMHNRMHLDGFRFYMDPRMKASYYCRDTVKGIVSQMYQIGYYFSRLASEGAVGSLQWRHKLPFLFYGLLLVLFIFSLFVPIAGSICLLVVCTYLGVIALEGIVRFLRTRSFLVLYALPLIPLIHASYALGTCRGMIWLITHPPKRES